MNETKETQNGGSSWAQGISVEDLKVAKKFYREVFGVKIAFEDNDSVVFNFKTMHVNLLEIDAANELIEPATVARREVGSRFVFTVNVDDVDATCAELTKRGVKLLNGPINRLWGKRTASFQDPAGYIWEIAR
jgi:predicted enzyme related to lactoylglutathione lyase